VQMAAAGLGVTLLPEMAVSVETQSARVFVSRFDGPAPRRQVGMIWRKSNPIGGQLHEIANLVRVTGLNAATG